MSSFAAVSLEPPLVSFCAGARLITWQRMRHAGRAPSTSSGRDTAASRGAPRPPARTASQNPTSCAMPSRRSSATSRPSMRPATTGSSSGASAGCGCPPTPSRSSTSRAASATSSPTDAGRELRRGSAPLTRSPQRRAARCRFASSSATLVPSPTLTDVARQLASSAPRPDSCDRSRAQRAESSRQRRRPGLRELLSAAAALVAIGSVRRERASASNGSPDCSRPTPPAACSGAACTPT